MPPPVSIAFLINLLDCAAFFGELGSIEYTNMPISRKNLPFIQFVATRQSLHQSVELLGAAALRGKLFQPFAEHGVEGFVLGFGQQARLPNQLLIGAKGNVFHTEAVHTILVLTPSALLQEDLPVPGAWGSSSSWVENMGKSRLAKCQLNQAESAGHG
jgi:hypothetical protein